ncbi:MAG: heparinase II/III family protein [Planctomycetes bacterium]|nr:heparinase II/III family protein [Planctomycetota bacterium]
MLYTAEMMERARANSAQHPWAAEIQANLIRAAQPWMKFSEQDLWNLMFGPTITRAWMVWSNGHCPSCRASVRMYSWKMDALNLPWKVSCPFCSEIFPKNDFHKFYRSGLDEHGVFDPKRGDRSLLFNEERPDPEHPLHGFGVDDGEGYANGEKRWRFIGAYLIYGQWKQGVLAGIRNLAAAYVVTGQRDYARRAAILLDRVADLYPAFDFGQQGDLYERKGGSGYVTTWHDACEETREMAIAYDQIRDALDGDEALVSFLSDMAERFQLSHPKSSVEEIRRNIEERIFRDAIQNRHKISSNYPRAEITLAILRSVLGGREEEAERERQIDAMLEQATSVDGVTGEKGLAGYAALVIQGLAVFLEQFARRDPHFLPNLLTRHPNLHQTYRFHIDTWCLQQQYYPLAGDTGAFAQRIPEYAGARFVKDPGLDPSMYTFLWRLYQNTGDCAFVQVIYRANGESVDGLPRDPFAENSDTLQEEVRAIIEREGAFPRTGSCNKQGWCLGILRSGCGPDERAAWLDYDTGGIHGQADGMNLGLFAKGLDLMPDFGYCPPQYGGGNSPRASWYRSSAAHNTVIVNGQSHLSPWRSTVSGRTTLWAVGEQFRAIRASGPEMILGQQFERTAALIDVSSKDSYLVDVFRVVGGSEHTKFMHSHFGQVKPLGLCLHPAEDFGLGTLMRNFTSDPSSRPGWAVDWSIEDRHGYLPPGSDIHVRYTDLTSQAEAWFAEGWVSLGSYLSSREAWIPRLMVRRRSRHLPLASTFISIIEPYEKESNIAGIRRLPLKWGSGEPCSESDVAVEIELADGRSDLLISRDVEGPFAPRNPVSGPRALHQEEWGTETDAELAFVRRDAVGGVVRAAVCRGLWLHARTARLELERPSDYLEARYEAGRAVPVSSTEAGIL